MNYFKEHGYYRIDVGPVDTRTPHAEGKFPTPSGKVELLLNDARNFVAPPFRAMYEGEQDGTLLDPLPGYQPVRESAGDQSGAGQALPAQHHLAQEPRVPQLVLRERAAQDQIAGRAVRASISPVDAAERNIREGDPVRVKNDRGDFEGVARVTEDVNPGIVVATLGYWRQLNRSDGSVNSISSDAWSNIGRAPTFSDNLVEVSRVN